MAHVALLRGINVGGNNKIDMKALRRSFERVGMADVATYINSGNIVFTSGAGDDAAIATTLETAIAEDFSLAIRVVVRSLERFELVMNALPSSWTNDKAAKSDVLFLWNEVDDESIVEKLGVNRDVDSVVYVPGAVLWSVRRDDMAESGMQKLASSKIARQMTIRNVNTTRRIYELLLTRSDAS